MEAATRCTIKEMTTLACGGDTWWLKEAEELSSNVENCEETCARIWGKVTVVAAMACGDGCAALHCAVL